MPISTKKYKQVPIAAAKRISEQYDKDQVIIICWDKKFSRTHITTYGATKEECRQAAKGGTVIARCLGLLTDGEKE